MPVGKLLAFEFDTCDDLRMRPKHVAPLSLLMGLSALLHGCSGDGARQAAFVIEPPPEPEPSSKKPEPSPPPAPTSSSGPK